MLPLGSVNGLVDNPVAEETGDTVMSGPVACRESVAD